MADPALNNTRPAAPGCAVDIIWAPKRGVGTSTIAAATAVRYAATGEPTALVDLADGDAASLVCLLSEEPRDPADPSRPRPVAISVQSDAANATIAVYAPGLAAEPSTRDALVFNAADTCQRVVIDAGASGPHLLRTLRRMLPTAAVRCTVVLANCYLTSQAAAAALHDAQAHPAATGQEPAKTARQLGYHRPVIVSQPDRYYTPADVAAHISQITGEPCTPTIVARSRHVAVAIDSASITQMLPRSLQRFELAPGEPPGYAISTATPTIEVPSP